MSSTSWFHPPKKNCIGFEDPHPEAGMLCYLCVWCHLELQGKLSLVLMSVPQKQRSKFGVVKKSVKKAEKLAFQSGTKKSLYCFFFLKLVKWPLGHVLTCTEGNIFINRKRHWELQCLRAEARLFMPWRRPKASINQNLHSTEGKNPPQNPKLGMGASSASVPLACG